MKKISSVLIFLFCLVNSVYAATYYVDPAGNDSNAGTELSPFKTIQHGINTSSNGDTVIVKAGTYSENVDYNGKAITVQSTDPDDSAVVAATIIDGDGGHAGVWFRNSEGTGSVLTGLTIINADRYGIYCFKTSPKITKCVIRNNWRGFYIRWITCKPEIEDCVIKDSNVDGLFMSSNGSPTLKRCTISNNGVTSGMGVYDFWGRSTLINCVIANNYTAGIKASTYTTVENCTIVDHTNTYYGQGIDGPCGTIINSILWNNTDDLKNCSATYSCIEDADAGTGNISSDPLFVDAANGDYHLSSGSPCIDAGDPAGAYSNEPSPNGGLLNMGAYGNTSEATTTSGDADEDGIPDSWELTYWPNDDPNQHDPNDDDDGDGLRSKDEWHLSWSPLVNDSASVIGFVNNSVNGFRYPSISSAVTNAVAGDVLVLDPNTFAESVDYAGKAITLTSIDPNNATIVAATIIDGNGSAASVAFDSSEGNGSILTGITVINGDSYGIHCSQTSPLISKCVIRNNYRGVYVQGATSSPAISDSVVKDSTLDGIYMTGNGAPSITRSTIISNGVTSGNGIDDTSGKSTITNCLVANNATEGIATSSYTTIENCTIVGHTNVSYGRGIKGPCGSISNSIIWGNTDDLLSCTATYSCIEDGDTGTGNISGDPLFVDANNDDYHVGINSPCIDAADPSKSYALEPQPNGVRLNMGAYGNTAEATSANVPWAASNPVPNNGVILQSIHVNLTWDSGVTTTSHDVYLGTNANDVLLADTNSSEFMGNQTANLFDPNTLEPNSVYYWRIDEKNSIGATIAGYVWSFTTQNVLYVDPSGNDSNAGTGQSPFATIQHGIDMAVDNEVVTIAPGTYIENIKFNGKKIVVTSSDPLDDQIVSSTIIQSNSSVSTVTFDLKEDENSVLQGFTITGSGRGIYCHGQSPDWIGASPTIKNCKIVNNNSTGIYLINNTTSPVVSNCEISGNSYGISGSGSSAPQISECLIKNNTYSGIQSTSSAAISVKNCIIVNNGTDGLWLSGSPADTILNCTIANNTGNGILTGYDTRIIKNCILWGNNDDLLGCSATYSCIKDGDTGTGNFTVPDVKFIDLLGGNYHLSYWSQCIDAGDPSSDYSLEPQPNGGRVNVGAYGNTIEAASNVDNDNDGIADSWENLYGLNSNDPNDALTDLDSDGFTNLVEFLFGYDPLALTVDSMKISVEGMNLLQIDPTLNESLSYDFWLNKTTTQLTIDYLEAGTSNVIHQVSQAGFSGINSTSWNGLDANDIIVMPSYYDIKITATNDPNDPNETVAWNSPAGDSVYQLLENIQISQADFDPYANIPYLIEFDLSDWSKVLVAVSEVLEGTVRNFLTTDGRLLKPGHYTFYWNGRVDNGDFFEGDYVTYIGPDTMTPVAAKNGQILVYYDYPDVSVANLVCNAYRILPMYNEVSTIDFDITRTSNVTIDIIDPDGNHFRTLTNSTQLTPGSYEIEWDGKDDNGRYISVEGVYTVKVITQNIYHPTFQPYIEGALSAYR